jgi:ElaB/YqjD/DUF883 family membrane-anchored ribosome-binding protein
MTQAALRKEIDRVRKDVAALGQDIGSLAEAVGELGSQRAHQVHDDVQRRLSAAKHAATERCAHGVAAARHGVEGHPLASVASALGVGLLAARLLRR